MLPAYGNRVRHDVAKAIAAHQAGDLARAERIYRKLIAAKREARSAICFTPTTI